MIKGTEEERKAYKAKWMREHREQQGVNVRKGELKIKYGITPEQYTEMFVSQGGVCAICKQPETSKDYRGKIRVLSVDHDHVTKRVRGLLCQRCNHAIGLLKDNPLLCRIAAEYLEKK